MDDVKNDNDDNPFLNQSETSAAYDKEQSFSDAKINGNDNSNKYNSNNNGINFNNFNNNNNGNNLNSPKLGNIGNIKDLKHYGSIVTPNYHLDNKQYQSIPNQPISNQLGSLKILPPKPSKLVGSDASIKNPNKVELKLRVTYNKETGVYDGLPKEWLKELNKQFGVAPKTLPGIKFDEYTAKVPTVIVNLANSIKNKNGWSQVGIFRLAPNATENNKLKEKINTNGKLNLSNIDSTDVNVYANLLKVWFRDLPEPILNCIDPTRVELVNNQQDALKVIGIMPDPQKSIFLWLCDMCVDCSQYQQLNKMSPQNLAIVIGPNLFNTDNFENPMKAMTFSQKVVEFFKHAINERIDVAKKRGTYKLVSK